MTVPSWSYQSSGDSLVRKTGIDDTARHGHAVISSAPLLLTGSIINLEQEDLSLRLVSLTRFKAKD